MKRFLGSIFALLLFATLAQAQEPNRGCLTVGCTVTSQNITTVTVGSMTAGQIPKGTGTGGNMTPSSVTDNATTVSTAESYTGLAFIGNGTPSVGTCGTGALSTGSNSFAGTITSTGATSCILTPGFTCANKVIVVTSNETHPGTGVMTANSTTTATISGQTAADVIDYIASCR